MVGIVNNSKFLRVTISRSYPIENADTQEKGRRRKGESEGNVIAECLFDLRQMLRCISRHYDDLNLQWHCVVQSFDRLHVCYLHGCHGVRSRSWLCCSWYPFFLLYFSPFRFAVPLTPLRENNAKRVGEQWERQEL